MSTKYSIGLTNQLADALEAAGYEPDDVTRMRSNVEALRQFKEVLEGRAQIVQVESRWREEDGVIYFTVTSNGKTGEEWIIHLESLGFRISDYAKQLLRSGEFKLTNGLTYEIAVLKGSLFDDNERITKKIRVEASRRKLTTPIAEIACLIRENFSDEELEAMGLYWIVTMHDPIKDSDGVPSLLSAGRDGGGRWLNACYGKPDRRWSRNDGFAFVASQV